MELTIRQFCHCLLFFVRVTIHGSYEFEFLFILFRFPRGALPRGKNSLASYAKFNTSNKSQGYGARQISVLWSPSVRALIKFNDLPRVRAICGWEAGCCRQVRAVRCRADIRPRTDDCVKPKSVVCLNQTGKVVRSQIQSLHGSRLYVAVQIMIVETFIFSIPT